MLDHSPIPFNVKFRVGRPGKKVITIEAHKWATNLEPFRASFTGPVWFHLDSQPIFNRDILAMGSEVFLKMFYGDLADKSEIIDVPDIYPRAFRLMIRYINIVFLENAPWKMEIMKEHHSVWHWKEAEPQKKEITFLYLLRFLYTEELPTALMEKDLTLAFEMMKCAGKYGIPYLYIQCRQWIVELFVDHFCSTKNVKTDALPYLRLVSVKCVISDQTSVLILIFSGAKTRVWGCQDTRGNMECDGRVRRECPTNSGWSIARRQSWVIISVLGSWYSYRTQREESSRLYGQVSWFMQF